MRKAIKTIIAIGMATLTMFSATSVFASSVGSIANDTTVGVDTAQNAQTTYAEKGIGTSSTDVYLTIDNSNITVGVPTTVIVSGTPTSEGKYIGDYSVAVSGDMSGSDVLTVEPDSSTIDLHQSGKNDITASVSQVKTVFNNAELATGTTTTGKVEATSLTAGSWNSSFVMNIQVKNATQENITRNKEMLKTFTAPKTLATTPNIVSWAQDITLTEEIGTTIYINPEAYPNATKVSVTYNQDANVNEAYNEGTVTYNLTNTQADGQYAGYYILDTINMTPAQINEKIKVSVLDASNNQIGTVIETSIADYCKDVIANNYDIKLTKLCGTLLDYGQVTKDYFNYYINDKIENSYYDPTFINITSNDINSSLTKNPTNLSMNGSMIFKATPELKFYFGGATQDEIDTAYNNGTLTVTNGLTLVPVHNGNYHGVQLSGFKASSLNEDFTIAFGEKSITTNGLFFAKLFVTNNTTEAMISKALVNYHLAAKDYFS